MLPFATPLLFAFAGGLCVRLEGLQLVTVVQELAPMIKESGGTNGWSHVAMNIGLRWVESGPTVRDYWVPRGGYPPPGWLSQNARLRSSLFVPSCGTAWIACEGCAADFSCQCAKVARGHVSPEV